MSDIAVAPAVTSPGWGGFIKTNLRQYGMLLSLFAIMIFFQIATDGTLLRPLNLTNLVLQNSYIVIMALGMLLVIVSGHIDLSVGSVAGFVGALAAVMMVTYHVPIAIAAILCLVAGGLIGAAQGYWVAYFKIPSFIVTLAGMLVFKGMMLAVLAGQSVGPFPVIFQRLSSGFVPEFINGPDDFHVSSLLLGIGVALVLVYLNVRNRARTLSHGVEVEPYYLFIVKNVVLLATISGFTWLIVSHRGLPNVLIIMLVLIGVYAFVTNRTIVGRQIYAVGGNRHAAKLSGIRTERLTFFTFVNMGVLAALAGMVFAARLNTATPKAGAGFDLDVIAACFIGGASAYGGVGINWQQVIKGLVLLAAVFFDVYNKNKG